MQPRLEDNDKEKIFPESPRKTTPIDPNIYQGVTSVERIDGVDREACAAQKETVWMDICSTALFDPHESEYPSADELLFRRGIATVHSTDKESSVVPPGPCVGSSRETSARPGPCQNALAGRMRASAHIQ
ncbi:conserved hypothetical protein [Coccidioides posadasii str. Silveira]|uniref:Uncharacterized protein n=2 Tax=Coccidioides posadasii TaxID=199306 RepID=E9D123_COCPS|nr:conserved hypothetical protein [Coccidioides posadasii str. Silveira]KMM73403.1 hypothetical protein CPAG_09692 [Coccidioides posadasii RMSCC 3488]